MLKTVAMATALAGTLLCAGEAAAQNADVMHWWTSGGESRAVAVFAKEYNKRGGTWVDDASVGPQAEHAAALNRIAGGNPPTAMQWNIGVAVRQLAEQGVLAPLDDEAKKGNWLANLPPLLVKNMTYEGHVIAVPVNIHGANYQFYSVKVFNDLKMQPPKTWEEFLADAPKIKAAGYIPIAFGANAQQLAWLSMQYWPAPVARTCTARCSSIMMPRRPAATRMQHVFDVMGQIRQYVDAGSPNRKWNDSLALVETDKAALMILGDWAKGDFAAANKIARQGLRLPDGAGQPGRLRHDGRCLRVSGEQQARSEGGAGEAGDTDDGSGRADRIQRVQGLDTVQA